MRAVALLALLAACAPSRVQQRKQQISAWREVKAAEESEAARAKSMSPPAGNRVDVVAPPPPVSLASSTSPTLRIIGELLLGAATGVGLGAAGWGAGIWIDCRSGDYCPATVPVIGGGIGLMLGLPIGVMTGGWLFDGSGHLIGVIAGELVGLLAGILWQLVLAPGIGVSLLLVLPIVGAAAGYEVSSWLRAKPR